MNAYIRSIITIALCGLYMSAMAVDRFAIKYKLNESQKTFLSSHSGADKEQAEEQVIKQLMENLSKDQLDALSKAADVKPGAKVQVIYSHPLATGAHVITLSEDLDETQTEQFIHNVKQDNNVEYFEEDKEVMVC